MKEQTRRLILDTAYELFEEKGYEKATMRELAKRAEVGLGTIFQHFKDKQSLVIAAFEDVVQSRFEEALRTLPDVSAGIKARLFHIVRYMLEFYSSRPHLSKTLIEKLTFVDHEHLPALIEREQVLLGYMADLLDQAVSRGEISSGLDINDALLALWSFYQSQLIRASLSSNFDVARIMTTLERLFEQHFAGFYGNPEAAV